MNISEEADCKHQHIKERIKSAHKIRKYSTSFSVLCPVSGTLLREPSFTESHVFH